MMAKGIEMCREVDKISIFSITIDKQPYHKGP